MPETKSNKNVEPARELRCRQTISDPLQVEGIGLHSGQPCTVRLSPAPPYTGRRLNGKLVTIDSVVDTRWSTTIHTPTGQVSMIEHLFAALYGLGIDDVDIDVQGPEIPILDGSAAFWMTHLKTSPHDHTDIRPITLSRPIRVGGHNAWVLATPSLKCHIRVDVDFESLGPFSFEAQMSDWAQAASARTFGFYEDWPELRAHGLAQGASLDSVLVFDGSTPLNPGGLRFTNEVARHKWLDLLGDLALLGRPFQGMIHAHRAGHTLHAECVRAILSENDFDFSPSESTLMNSATESD